MKLPNTTINLQSFYPSDQLTITAIEESSDTFLIHLKSVTNSCKCPKCGLTSNKYHGTYIRKVQDLPILGKHVSLEITSHEYNCENRFCATTTIAESYDQFVLPYHRMTERLADFLCTLALETSCEGAARIAKKMNIKTSGDTIIKLLTTRYRSSNVKPCGEVIGIDDFAFKKRHHYGMIIADEKTHKTIDILEGRDGESLRAWLQKNKQIKAVTRDRASAYAKVLEEELPWVMQIAERFHLHQNLLDVIKKVLYREVESVVKIPMNSEHLPETKMSGKKNTF